VQQSKSFLEIKKRPIIRPSAEPINAINAEEDHIPDSLINILGPEVFLLSIFITKLNLDVNQNDLQKMASAQEQLESQFRETIFTNGGLLEKTEEGRIMAYWKHQNGRVHNRVRITQERIADIMSENQTHLSLLRVKVELHFIRSNGKSITKIPLVKIQ